jgi:hypothetical protein
VTEICEIELNVARTRPTVALCVACVDLHRCLPWLRVNTEVQHRDRDAQKETRDGL